MKKKKSRKKNDRSAVLDAIRMESEADLIDHIRRLLKLPMNKRTNFLRKRIPGGGSCL